MSKDRIMPSAVEIEKQVIGAMMINNEAILRAQSVLHDSSALYSLKHRYIYEAIIHLWESGVPVDVAILSEHLETSGTLEDAGGYEYLVDLAALVGTTANAEHHALIVMERALRRMLITIMRGTIEELYDSDDNVSEIAGRFESQWMETRRQANRKRTVYTLGELMNQDIKRLQKGNPVRVHATTNFPELSPDPQRLTPVDEMLGGGWTAGELHMIASLPSCGKTSMMVQMAYTSALTGTRVGIIVLEGQRDVIPGIAAAQLAGISRSKYDNGGLSEEELDNLKHWQEEVASLPVWVDDMADARPAKRQDVALRVKTLVWEHQCDVVFIDHLTKIQYNPANEVSEIGNIVSMLHDASVSDGVAVVLLHHLGTAYEDAQRKEGHPIPPGMHHFSVSPQAISRYVSGMYALINPTAGTGRPASFQDADDPTLDWSSPVPRAELISYKSKVHDSGYRIPLAWNGKQQKFSSYSKATVSVEYDDDPYIETAF